MHPDGRMEQVKRMLAAGVSFATAVKECLLQQPEPLTIEAFAAKYDGVSGSTFSAAINGAVKPSESVIDALVAELGGTPYEWRMAMWEAARPSMVEA